jgi:glycosyltransferase involved in cell wall biosynthesis
VPEFRGNCPFLRNVTDQFPDVLKLHEYLACGKPVVATPLPNLREFADVLYFAEDTSQWVQAIEQALGETNPELRTRRQSVARENSWDSRVHTIIRLFDKNLDGHVRYETIADFERD